uniref:WD repeat and SOCS box-containing 2 n=1 Tax=Nothobranchius rachovii TaxID=451742 RepID=A0A1A8NJJ3_9TELE
MCSESGSSAELQPASPESPLLLELKTRRPPSLLDLAGCETWSVDFSPDGAWFAWSMGHGIVWVVAWPLDSEEGQDGETDRGDKSFSCGHPVWGLAFGPRPPKSARLAKTASKGKNILLLATGLENGVIKIWNVLTGSAVFDLHGHEGVVRDLVFPQNGSLTLISSSRDKTLRIWDLAHKAIVTDDRALRVWEPGERRMTMQTKRGRDSNGLCCNYHPQGGVIATGTRDGHVRFWRAPRTVPSLCHLCRSILRHSVSTHQMEALPLPRRILEYLTYRNIPERLRTCCSSDEEDWES